MIKILFLINSLGGGGAERVLVNLVNNMDLSKYDITVQTIFKAGVNKGILSSEIRLIEGKTKSFKGISNIIKLLPSSWLYNYYIKDDYDIVIAYMHGLPTKILSSAPQKTKKIAWLHTDMHNSTLSKVMWQSQIVETFNVYDKIVGVAKSVSQSFIDMYGLSEKVITCYNTNDVKKIQQLASENINKTGWNDQSNCIKIITIGRLSKEKGFSRLICCCSKLKNEGYNFKLLFLGKGPLENELRQLCITLSLENDIIFGGYQENPYSLLKKADLFVCSSIQEGLNTAMSEAIILGVPVISTKVSGASEVIGENNEYGLMVENNDLALYEGLKKILSHQELLKEYRAKSIERAQFFDTSTTVRATEKLIDEVYSCRD